MTMRIIIQSQNVFATSTNTSASQKYAVGENVARSDTAVSVISVQRPVHPDAKPSRRTGRMPAHVVEHERENASVAYRHKMEFARSTLGQQIEEVMPKSLVALRLKRGMSQSQLAQMIGTSQPHIAKIEAGNLNLYWATAVRIADALAISMDELRGIIEVVKPVETEVKTKVAAVL
jgi:DNA-binding XRE family transcriptional regulator